MKLRKKMHKLLAVFLALSLSLSLVSVPAFAADGGPLVCKEEAHTHTAECYGDPQLICGLEESEGHTHEDECYATAPGGELICGQEESKGHTHEDGCYGEPVSQLTCELEESEGHTHGDDCYTTETVLSCEIPEDHHHTIDCYERSTDGFGEEMTVDGQTYLVKGLACTIPEGHTHTAECYTEEKVLTCSEEESEGHTHTIDCYQKFCSMEAHEHEAACYDAEGNLICTLPEHTHSDPCCKPLICGKEEHTHTAECYAVPENDDPPSEDEPTMDTENEQGGSESGVTFASENVTVTAEKREDIKKVSGYTVVAAYQITLEGGDSTALVTVTGLAGVANVVDVTNLETPTAVENAKIEASSISFTATSGNTYAFTGAAEETKPCICETKCTEDHKYESCTVCTAEGADLDEVCKGCSCTTKCTEVPTGEGACPACSSATADTLEGLCKGTSEQSQQPQESVEVKNLSDLLVAINNGVKNIEVTADEPITVSDTIEISRTVTITGGTITRDKDVTIFNVATGGNLTLGGLTSDKGIQLKGTEGTEKAGNTNSPVVIESGGTVTMNNATITGFVARRGGGVNVKGALTLNGGANIDSNTVWAVDSNRDADAAVGGGIYIDDGGSVVMNPDSSVDNNKATVNDAFDQVAVGGGIAIKASGAFTMNGGSISYNSVNGCLGIAEGGGIAIG